MEKIKLKQKLMKITNSKKRSLAISIVGIALIFALFASPLFAVLPPQYIYGSITVNSNPSGATISLVTPDGMYVGSTQTTPYTFTNITPGWSTISLSLGGYQNWTTQVYVNAGENEYVYGSLTPAYNPNATGSITVTSQPAGAIVQLITPAGLFVGPSIKTPYTFTNVPVGISSVTFSMNGHHDWSSNIKVQAGQNTNVNAVLTPIESKGSIYITSSPSGATIGVDGQWWGTFRTTPNTVMDLTPGHHVVQLSMEGYQMWSTTVDVSAGGTTYVQATLLPEDMHGALSITSDPLGATVSIETPHGMYVGEVIRTPYLLDRVDIGYSTITFYKDGYEPLTKRVYVKADGVTFVDAELKPILFK
ncbi:MAG TPA: PEGA domain-containing protein [Candidatus Methanofastidiosum sp.]|nr:PEGA domain-containing protein [Methanofastidiosum sp.]